MTKTERTRLAKQSTQHGYFQTSSKTVATSCPLCKQRVEVEHFAWDKERQRIAALHAEVARHLEWEHAA